MLHALHISVKFLSYLGSLYGVGTKASSISALSIAHRLKAVECSFQNMPLDFFLVNRSKVILTRILKLQFVALNMAHTVRGAPRKKS